MLREDVRNTLNNKSEKLKRNREKGEECNAQKNIVLYLAASLYFKV